MKNYLLLLSLCIPVTSFAQKTEDEKAIKSMCGCYEVKFNFAETFSYPKDKTKYTPSEVKHETALEWAQLVDDEQNKISIQHLLIVGKDMIVKHWRQDWLFENTNFYDYNGFNDWKFVAYPKEKVKGQWTQKVYEVDDKPRYEGSASWIHVDGRKFWENKTNAPLPRREYTERDDYNITKRLNDIEIVGNGWIHNQDNDKIVKDEAGNEYILAQEKGYNTYTKVDDSKCELAQKWWQENKDLWKKVRQKWDVEFAKNKNLKLKEKHEGKPLYVHLQALKKEATQAQINSIIESFIIAN